MPWRVRKKHEKSVLRDCAAISEWNCLYSAFWAVLRDGEGIFRYFSCLSSLILSPKSTSKMPKNSRFCLI